MDSRLGRALAAQSQQSFDERAWRRADASVRHVRLCDAEGSEADPRLRLAIYPCWRGGGWMGSTYLCTGDKSSTAIRV